MELDFDEKIYNEHLSSIESNLDTLERLGDIKDTILKDGPCVGTMESLDFLCAGMLPEESPLNTFTIEPSATNAAYALEGIISAIGSVIKFIVEAIVKSLTYIFEGLGKLGGFVGSKFSRNTDNLSPDAVESIVSRHDAVIDDIKDAVKKKAFSANSDELLAGLTTTFNTELDFKILNQQEGYKLEDALETVSVAVSELGKMSIDLNNVIVTIRRIYNDVLSGSDLHAALSSIEGYMMDRGYNTLPYSIKPLITAIKSNGGHAPTDVDKVLDLVSRDIDVKFNLAEAFWVPKFTERGSSREISKVKLQPLYNAGVKLISKKKITASDFSSLVINKKLQSKVDDASDDMKSVGDSSFKLLNELKGMVKDIERKDKKREGDWDEKESLSLCWPSSVNGIRAGNFALTHNSNGERIGYQSKDMPGFLIRSSALQTGMTQRIGVAMGIIVDITNVVNRSSDIANSHNNYILAKAKELKKHEAKKEE